MENISVQQLGTEVPVHDAPEELKVVIHSFNVMLHRLNDSFLRLAEFSSDIAHELRTPLHGLMIQTQVALSGDRSKADYKAALQANMEEFDRLSRMVNDMLFLAKADNRQLPLKQQPIDLLAEVEHIFEFYEALAAESGVLLQASGPSVYIPADRIMLQRVLSNLVSNALRYTATGLAVTANIVDLPNEIRLSISNPGEEIPPDKLEKLFDRFFRLDQARIQSDAGHAGLGLSIVQAIAKMHGWTMEVASANGCTIFTVRMPK
jgi:two-component system heavy metal sensor histidine kinase CusS